MFFRDRDRAQGKISGIEWAEDGDAKTSKYKEVSGMPGLFEINGVEVCLYA